MTEYKKEIFKMCEEIIENKDYEALAQILKNYDFLVKEANGIKDEEKPYWCGKLWWGSKGDDNNEI